jgi:hypothetical protein
LKRFYTIPVTRMARKTRKISDYKPAESIISRIYVIRGQKLMLDHDLAALYGVETKVLNQAVKRNLDRFPEEFMFRLSSREWLLIRPKIQENFPQPIDNEQNITMRSQIVTASAENVETEDITLTKTSRKRNLQATPYAFTEHGVGMAANFLKTERAVQMSIAIIKTFIHLRKHVLDFAALAGQIESLKTRQGEYDVQLKGIYDAIESLLDDKTEKENQLKNRRRIGFKPDA